MNISFFLSHIWVQNGHISILTPTLNIKWSKIDFGSYFEHKLICSCQKILFGGKQTLWFFSPQRGSINLVDLENMLMQKYDGKMNIWLQESALIQTRTSHLKCAVLVVGTCSYPRLVDLHPEKTPSKHFAPSFIC